jgi:hypothetical protein
LIGLSPLFGPLAAAAFAMAHAFGPFLQLFGPLVAQYPALATQLQPVLGPLLSEWNSILTAGFTNLLAPLYAPYRQQFLNSEVQLAGILAPYAQQLAGSPTAACIVDIEGQLTAAAG